VGVLLIAAIFTFPATARGQTSAEPTSADIPVPMEHVEPAAPEPGISDPAIAEPAPVPAEPEPAQTDLTEPGAAEPAPAAPAPEVAPGTDTPTAPETAPPSPPEPAAPTVPIPPAATAPAATAPTAPSAPVAVAIGPATAARSERPRRLTLRRSTRQATDEQQTTTETCVVTGPDGTCLITESDCDVRGGNGDDTLEGENPEPEIICGLDGNDQLSGGDEDTLVGGSGEDSLRVRGRGGTGGDGGGGPDACTVQGDSVDSGTLGSCESVSSFSEAVEEAPPPPATDTTGGDQDVVSQTTNAGQVYVAITRYVQSRETPTEAIASIVKSPIEYADGRLSFLVSCSYAGDGRVTLSAFGKGGKRIRLGAARFTCAGEGDDPIVPVEISAAGRRLLEGGRVRIRAYVVDPDLERQPRDARQSFVFSR
jgi:hypothetical protein